MSATAARSSWGLMSSSSIYTRILELFGKVMGGDN